MKTITIRELHASTGRWVREATRYGQIIITDNGRTVAKILPEGPSAEAPYFARRKMTPAFKKLQASGKLRGGTDVTEMISDERHAR